MQLVKLVRLEGQSPGYAPGHFFAHSLFVLDLLRPAQAGLLEGFSIAVARHPIFIPVQVRPLSSLLWT